MAASNPFVYGEVVPRSAFVGRAAELARLSADLADGQKIFLISPRRYGKSSLIAQAFASLQRRRIATLEITVSSFSSYVAFLEGYTRALAALDESAATGRSWLADLFSFPPEIRAESGGAMAVSFPTVRSARDAAKLGAEVFALPARIAARLRRRLVIAMDEFQAVASYEGAGPLNVEEALRAAVQQQRQVGYVFAGSEPSLMEQMVSPRRPFYKAGPVLRLGRIDPDTFARFIEDRFRRSGMVPEHGLGAAIVEVSGNLPYDVQRLAHETWDDVSAFRRRKVELEDVHATLRRLLAEQEVFFDTIWQRLTLAQRSVLRAVVIERGVEILGADVRHRHRLGGASSVQTSLAALQRLDVVAREDDGQYAVVDSVMREWVARKTY